jgi:hypothetical protein
MTSAVLHEGLSATRSAIPQLFDNVHLHRLRSARSKDMMTISHDFPQAIPLPEEVENAGRALLATFEEADAASSVSPGVPRAGSDLL